MKFKIEYFLFTLAFLVKFLLSMIISVDLIVIFSTLGLILVYTFMLHKRFNVYTYLPFVMIDFSLQLYFCYLIYGFSIESIYMSFVFFIFTSGFMYSLIVYYASDFKGMKTSSNLEIDKGIKALENEDYDLAVEAFSNAIRDHKKNYLGYMGMCNTLTKMDKKNLRKLNYYKKKCIKYAPKELKKSISERYN